MLAVTMLLAAVFGWLGEIHSEASRTSQLIEVTTKQHKRISRSGRRRLYAFPEPIGMFIRERANQQLTYEGGAECYWNKLIEPLQW